MINVLHVFVTLPVGGAEQLLLSLTNRLNSSKVNSVICCINNKGEIGEKIQSNGHKVYELQKLKKNGWDSSIVNDICHIIDTDNIDIIHSQLYHSNLYSRLAAKRNNISSVISIHNTYSKRPKLHRRVLNWYLSKYTSAILVDSKDIKADIVKFDRVPDGLVHIIPSAVNLDSINTKFTKCESRAVLGINKDDFVLGTVGRLEEQKGHKFLLEALSILKKENIYIKLILIGDGRLRKDLEVLSKILKIEKQVLFLGTRADIADLFPAMDVFIMPSLWEGLSVAMLTAMAAKLPVIATDVGGVKGVLEENSCGMVVKSGDASKLAQAIEQLMNNKPLLKRYASLGREVVKEKYSDVSMAKSILELYDSVLVKTG